MSLSSGVIFLAAGSSQRFGHATPKQFLRMKGEPLFLKSLRIFIRQTNIHEIVFVTQKPHFKTVLRSLSRLNTRKKIVLVEGGSFRGESVKNGMRALSGKTDVVLVHDSARPLVTPKIIRDVQNAAFKTGVALAAWPLPDTLKKAIGAYVKKTVPRKDFWLAQTPQGFRTSIAKKCLLAPSKSATDDVELAERKGYKVALVLGSPTNMKVTYPNDLKICQKFI